MPNTTAVVEVRRLWFSSEFEEKHASLARLLRAATTWPGSCWSLAADTENSDVALTTTAGATEARRALGAARVRTGRDLLTAVAEVDLEATGGTF